MSAEPAAVAAPASLRTRLRWPRATWVLLDQGVLSLGTFLLSVTLARHLPLATFGLYALFLSAMTMTQTVGNAVIFYPLSVRATVLPEAERRRLIRSALRLTLIVGTPLALLFGLVIQHFVAPGLLVPAACLLLAGQVQECTRRGLLCDFRHRTAIAGDAVSYLGQVLVVMALARFLWVDLAGAFYAIAATSAAGALLQTRQLGLWRGERARSPALWPTLRDFWSLGRWSLGSNLLVSLRNGALPWLLASIAGPAAAGALQLAVNVANVANPVVIGISNVIPQAAARGRREGARAALRLTLPYLATGLPIVGALALVMLAAPERILALAYARPFTDAALFEAVRIMAVGTLFGFLSAGVCAHLYGTGDGPAALVGDIVASVAVLAAALPLIAGLGLRGACLASALGLAARTAWMSGVVLRRLAQERRRSASSALPASVATDGS